MPASSAYAVDSASVGEMSRQNSIEDQRAMQLALELSLLNIGNGNELHHQYGSHHQHGSGSLSPASTAQLYHQHTMDQIASLHYADEIRYLTKKSQNMTECVPVPSSEHVAEIVGRQGCKIKALRAKTNTYIKTPVRGEEPVFVVTGRKEDVCSAKREILSAAEHFSQIRASRRSGLIGQCGLVGATGLVPPPPVPGQVTIQVRVPYRVVGLVVGPKGATIKRIQQQSSTYIVTPSREKEPIFEVTGMPDNVEQAKREIEGHIAIRTGLVNVDGSGNDLSSDMMMHDLAAGLNGLGFSGMLGGMDTNGLGSNDLMGSLYKNPSALRSAFGGHNDYSSASLSGNSSSGLSQLLGDHTFGGLRSSNNSSNAFNSAAHGSKMESSELQTLGSGLLNSLYDSDEGIGLGGSDSPTLSHSLIQPNIWSTDFGLAGSSSTTAAATNAAGAKRSNSFGFPTQDSEHPPARRISSDPLTAIGTTLSSLSAAFQIRSDSDSGVRGDSSASGSASPAASPAASSSSSSSSTRGSLKRECIMCCEGEMVAALVPCGHKLFCMDCAQSLVTKTETAAAAAAVAASNAESTEDSSEQEEAAKSGHGGGECPVCHQSVTQAIRIFS